MIIRKHGGTPLKQYGPDGIIRGKPVEVRSIKSPTETRFRLMKSTHKELLKNNGKYIFNARGKEKTLTANKVQKILEQHKRNWYKDRTYPHTFIKIPEVFKKKKRI